MSIKASNNFNNKCPNNSIGQNIVSSLPDEIIIKIFFLLISDRFQYT